MSDAIVQLLVALGIVVVAGLGLWAITEAIWYRTDRRPHCTKCGARITGRPVYATNVEFWRGNQADPYCSQACVDADTEEANAG